MKVDLGNPNIQSALLLLVLLFVMGGVEYVPLDKTVKSVVVFTTFVGIFAFLVVQQYALQAIYAVYKHIGAKIRLPDGNKCERDFFLPPETESATLREIDLGDGWYSFKLKLKKKVRLGDMEADEVIIVSPAKFDDTFDFRPSEKAAIVNGIALDHPASDIATFYLYPIPYVDHDKNIPILYVVEAGGMFPTLARNFPREPLPSKDAMMAQVGELQRRLLELEYTNKMRTEQLASFIEYNKSIKKAIANHIKFVRAHQATIENMVQPSRLLRLDLTVLAVVALIALLVGYAYLNPAATATFLTYLNSLMPYLIILAAIAVIILLLLRRRR